MTETERSEVEGIGWGGCGAVRSGWDRKGLGGSRGVSVDPYSPRLAEANMSLSAREAPRGFRGVIPDEVVT